MSTPVGVVDLKPSSICKVVVFVIRRIDESVDVRFFDASSKSAKVSENKEEATVLSGGNDEKIRKNGLQIKKEAEEIEKEMIEKEKIWETPAFLRKK